MLVNNLLLIILFYLIGSLPFALILTKLSGFGDIRNIGSGERITNKHIIEETANILNIEPIITSVQDRLGHDRRYGLKTNYKETKINKKLLEYVGEFK